MLYTKEKLEELRHRWTTTKGKKLIKIIKHSHCYLSPVLFRQKVSNFPGINDEEVRESVDLRGIPLSGYDFRVQVKEDDDGFFEDIAIFSNIHFEGAILKHCSFQDGRIHDCFFENADLSHSEFKNANLNNCNFPDSDLTGANFTGAKLINCSFVNANIRDIVTSSTIIDQKSTFGQSLKSEGDNNLHFAAIEHKQIKEMYKNSSLHELADNHHYKEMVAKRKSLTRWNPKRTLNFIFGDILSKYGTSFNRVLITSALVIFICAFFYTKHDSLVFHNQVIEQASLMDSVYFSTVTFTTLGYGDYSAIGGMRYVAALESFLGAALMSLFTVIVARNIIRD